MFGWVVNTNINGIPYLRTDSVTVGTDTVDFALGFRRIPLVGYLTVNITGVLSSQEEVGERGACVVRNAVQPQIAICFEGCPADDTVTESYAIQTGLKKGPINLGL